MDIEDWIEICDAFEAIDKDGLDEAVSVKRELFGNKWLEDLDTEEDSRLKLALREQYRKLEWRQMYKRNTKRRHSK